MSLVEWFREVDCKMCQQKMGKHPIKLVTADLSLIDYLAGREKVVNIIERLLLARVYSAVTS